MPAKKKKRAATTRELGADAAPPPRLSPTGPPATAGESPIEPDPLPPNPGPRGEHVADEAGAEPGVDDAPGLDPLSDDTPLTPETLVELAAVGRAITARTCGAAYKLELPPDLAAQVYSLTPKERATLEALARGAGRYLSRFVSKCEWLPAVAFGIAYVVGTVQLVAQLKAMGAEQAAWREENAAREANAQGSAPGS